MAEKEKIVLQRSDDFQEVEDELSAAMAALDQTNARIGSLLQSYIPVETTGGLDDAEDEAGQPAPEAPVEM